MYRRADDIFAVILSRLTDENIKNNNDY